MVYRKAKRKFVLRWKDPETGAWREKTSPTQSRKESEKLAAQLEADLREGRYEEPSKITWEDFRLAFETEKLPSLAQKTKESYRSALNHIERRCQPARLAEVDAIALSKMQAAMRQEGLRDATIASHLRHIKAAFSWAHELGMLVKPPKIQMPKRSRKQRQMRGRPITREEFERMLEACSEVRPKEAGLWRGLLEGLWLSGLRLGEALQLSWDAEDPISINLEGKYPSILIDAEAEKGFQDRLLPLTPDFAEWLLLTPDDERSGRVFGLAKLGRRLDCISKTITQIGKQARVVVNKEQDKFASAHDLRRAFGTRWAAKVQPAILRQLMRHESIETTMKFYVGIESDEIGRQLEQVIASNGASSLSKSVLDVK